MLPSIFGENLFDDFFNKPLEAVFGNRSPLLNNRGWNLMKTDVKETDNAYELDVDLPGFKKDEVNVEFTEGYLTISAAKTVDSNQQDQGRYLRQERFTGQCSRSFYVGDVEADQITAKFEDGILRLTVPKRDQKRLAAQNRIAIQ